MKISKKEILKDENYKKTLELLEKCNKINFDWIVDNAMNVWL